MNINNIDLDNKHSGNRGFVVGGGPSIIDIQDSGFDFKTLQREITVVANQAYKLLDPTYLVAIDGSSWRQFGINMQAVDNCIKFCPDNVAKSLGIKNVYILERAKKVDGMYGTIFKSFKDPIPMWPNAGVTCLRIAYVLGLNPIYLVGIDMIRVDASGRTHFHNDYSEREKSKTKDKRYIQFYDNFILTINDLQKLGINIISCSKTSKLNSVIPYVDIQNLGI